MSEKYDFCWFEDFFISEKDDFWWCEDFLCQTKLIFGGVEKLILHGVRIFCIDFGWCEDFCNGEFLF